MQIVTMANDNGWPRLPVLLLTAMLSIFQAALANDLEGIDDARLQQAIDTWLDDNDADSLPVIADLAGNGNVAARILVARIEETDRAPSDFVANLSRAERVALFRSTSGKGVFRPSWLKFEAKNGNRMAMALSQASQLRVDLAAIDLLYQLGEPQASFDLVRQVGANGSKVDKARLLQRLTPRSELAPYVRALQNPQSGLSPGLAALQEMANAQPGNTPETSLKQAHEDTISAARFIEMGYQAGLRSIDFEPENSHYDTLANWIFANQSTRPVARICNQYCDENERTACAVTAFGLIGGYYKIIMFDSPVENIIEQSRYLSSARASGMLLRRVATIKKASGSGRLASAEEIREKSACLVRAIQLGAGR